MTAEHAVARFIRAQNSDLEWRGWWQKCVDECW